MTLPDNPESLWIDTAPDGAGGQPFEPVSVDVAVVGAGIVGVAVADMLKREGKTVALLESKEILRGATGYTTAKVTSQHGAKYAGLVDAWGEDAARTYARANQDAIDEIARTIEERGIDCDFERKAAYVFTESDDETDDVRAEADAARRVGLPASFVTETSLPFRVAGAVRFDDQAQFHPRKYLLPLARSIPGDGSYLFESTRATGVSDGDICTVTTDRGEIEAGYAVVATHLPFLDRGLFFAKTHPERSYIVAGRAGAEVPDGMFISYSGPTRSIRTAPAAEGTLLLLGGEGHKVGQEPDTEARYRALEAYGRDRFGIEDFGYRWSTQDQMSADGIPFVGRAYPGAHHVLTATGFGKWGMTNGIVAAVILRDAIVGRDNEWSELFDAARMWHPLTSLDLYRENVNAGFHWFADRFRGAEVGSVEDVPVGQGAIVRVGGRKTAVYRDETAVYALSPVCTHLGCIVGWNSADKSWDCPCHGSRFDAKGKVIQGPAVRDLRERSL